jgi:hypothetical protein
MSDTSIQQIVENAPFPHDTTGRYAGWLNDRIRKRAYEIYEARGDLPGTPEGDWFHAERELRFHFGL